MLSAHDVAPVLADAIYGYVFENELLNPEHKPVAAHEPRGVYALLRMLTGLDARDAVMAAGLRMAGYRLVQDRLGWLVERDFTASTPAPQQADGPRVVGASAAAPG